MAEEFTQLEVAKKLFSEWRTNRKSPRDHMPSELVQAATRVAKEIGVARTVKELRICKSHLVQTKRVKLDKILRQQKKEIEIKVTKVVPVASESAASMEIVFSVGAKIRVFEKGNGLAEALRASIIELSGIVVKPC